MNINLEDNLKMKEAYDLVCNTNENLFITGKAGTGKTTLLHYLVENCDKNITVVSPTGIAAINAGGTTIHSQFGLPFGPFRPNIVGKNTYPGLDSYALRPDKIAVLKKMDTLIIDEISMVRADLLDAINDVLCVHRGCNSKMFGGVQVVMFGDLYQLSPIVQREEEEILKDLYQSFYFFDSWALKLSDFRMIELDKIYRQQDPVFINILNEVRTGVISNENYSILSKKCKPRFKSEENMITVCSHNSKADKINAKELEKLNTKEHVFECSVEGEFNKNSIPCDMILRLKEGAQVMFLVNDPEQRFCNGTIGTVEYIHLDEEGQKVVIVKLENGLSIQVTPHTWDNNKFSHDSETDKIKRESIGKCTQIPLRLAWAITIHKSQGLTFDKVIIDAGRSFATGQVYVALSRCRTLENMHLISMFSKEQISCDRKIVKFMRNKRNEQTNQNN